MSLQELYEILEERLYKVYLLSKFNISFKKEFGYSYMLKEKSNFEAGFRKMKLIKSENHKLSRNELMQLIDEYSNVDLPNDNLVPWELLIGSQPIEWRDDKHNYYFSLGRYHHAIGDGVALMKLMIGAYGDIEKNTKGASVQFSKKNFNATMKIFKLFIEKFVALILIPSWYVSTLVLKGRNKNILKRKKLSNQFHYVMNVEDSSDYVQKIKRIKNKIPDVSFSDVLLTAISASLNDFFTKARL